MLVQQILQNTGTLCCRLRIYHALVHTDYKYHELEKNKSPTSVRPILVDNMIKLLFFYNEKRTSLIFQGEISCYLDCLTWYARFSLDRYLNGHLFS